MANMMSLRNMNFSWREIKLRHGRRAPLAAYSELRRQPRLTHLPLAMFACGGDSGRADCLMA
jgi:hypothetical protein